MAAGAAELLSRVEKGLTKAGVPDFDTGDTLRVSVRIIEGQKERIQVFEGVVIKRVGNKRPNATFTVRKVSYNIGVERTFFVNSPRLESIEVVARGKVRRARLFYLRPLRGKASRIEKKRQGADNTASTAAAPAMEAAAPTAA